MDVNSPEAAQWSENMKLKSENEHLRSVMKSLLSCAEVWIRKADPEWDGSAKPWSTIGIARAAVMDEDQKRTT